MLNTRLYDTGITRTIESTRLKSEIFQLRRRTLRNSVGIAGLVRAEDVKILTWD